MEIEAVLLDINKKDVEAKLLSLGAKKVFDEDMHQVNYKTEQKDTLRVRQEGTKILLNLKKRVKDSKVKTADEYEAEVGDFDAMTELLEATGLTPFRTLNKHRTSYVKGDIRYDIDTYLDEHSYVPTFLEVEGESEEAVVAAALELGFAESDIKNFSTSKIIKHYQKD